jgi:hypothetical protein
MTSRHSKPKSVFKSFWDNSQTKIWSYIQTGVGATVLAVGQLYPYISDSTIKSYFDELNLPKEVALGMVVFGLITYVCHGHAQDT